jgi:hypothetical protein
MLDFIRNHIIDVVYQELLDISEIQEIQKIFYDTELLHNLVQFIKENQSNCDEEKDYEGILLDDSEIFISLFNLLRKILISKFENPEELNPLQPSYMDCIIISALEKAFDISLINLSYDVRMNILLKLEPCGSKGKKVLKDQELRAIKLIHESQGYKHICFMDGHGTFIYYLLFHMHQLYERTGYKDFPVIHVVDVVESVNIWHKIFFGDIFVIPDTPQDIFQYTQNFTDMYVYYNFCGIGTCVYDLTRVSGTYMLSLSTIRSMNIINKFINNEVLLEEIPEQTVARAVCDLIHFNNVELVSRRKDFITFIISTKY